MACRCAMNGLGLAAGTVQPLSVGPFTSDEDIWVGCNKITSQESQAGFAAGDQFECVSVATKKRNLYRYGIPVLLAAAAAFLYYRKG